MPNPWNLVTSTQGAIENENGEHVRNSPWRLHVDDEIRRHLGLQSVSDGETDMLAVLRLAAATSADVLLDSQLEVWTPRPGTPGTAIRAMAKIRSRHLRS
eukprot:2737975-Amphidinium_carterae.1